MRPYRDSENISRILLWVATKKDLALVHYSGQSIVRKPATHEYYEVLKGSGNICKLSETLLGRTIIQLYGSLFNQYGNMSLACPILEGFYYADFPMSELRIPPFIPVFNRDFNVTGSIKTRSSKGKFTKIFDLFIIGSIKN